MNNFPKDPKEFVEMMQEYMPKVSATSNGYEIRTKILAMAQQQVFQDYQVKLDKFEAKGGLTADESEYLQTMSYPGAEKVLEVAEQFNKFVSGK